MSEPCDVLLLCAGKSARSLLAGILLKLFGEGQREAFERAFRVLRNAAPGKSENA